MNSKYSQDSKQGIVNMSLTHEEIAQMIGTSRETVTRLFADFKERHILEGTGSTLAIADMATLRHIATP